MSNWRNILLWRMPERSKFPEPIAFYTISNGGGIGIIELDDERVIYAFYGDGDSNYTIPETEDDNIFEAAIEWVFDEDEDEPTELKPCFRHGDTVYFLSDFMRTDR